MNTGLIRLMREIAAANAAEAGRLLDAAPALALEKLAAGATRGSATDFFLEPIRHYVYTGDTALHVAAAAHELPTVRRLLKSGADIHARNRRGATPLHYATNGGPEIPAAAGRAQAAVIACLVRHGADPDAGDKGGVTPLQRAVRNRCIHAVRALLTAGADPGLKSKSGGTAISVARQNTGRGGSGSDAAIAAQRLILSALDTR